MKEQHTPFISGLSYRLDEGLALSGRKFGVDGSTALQVLLRRPQPEWCLIKADESNEPPSSSSQIAQALEISPRTVIRIKQCFVQQGLQAALRCNFPQERPLRRKVDGRVEAHLIAIACGPALQDHRRWTMQLLVDQVVDLGIVDQISDETIRLALKKGEHPQGQICGEESRLLAKPLFISSCILPPSFTDVSSACFPIDYAVLGISFDDSFEISFIS